MKYYNEDINPEEIGKCYDCGIYLPPLNLDVEGTPIVSAVKCKRCGEWFCTYCINYTHNCEVPENENSSNI